MAPRVLLVGWDAADWKMIRPLMAAGHMPTVKALIDRGVHGNLTTLSPILSPMLWTSIATGKRPWKHGVHGFSEPTPDGTSVRPVTSYTRTARAMWNILNLQGLRSHVVGWWPSHPAEPINGVMVSNQYQRAPKGVDRDWKMAPGTVHPERLAETLAELRLHPAELTPEHILPFVPNAEKIDQDKDRRLDSLMRIIADCTSIQSAATWLLENESWDFAAVYFDAIDHFGHGFMKYGPPKQDFISDADFEIYHQVVQMGYVYHDMMLARLLELAGPETTVLLISDHGFHPDHLRLRAVPMEPAGPAAEHRDQGIFIAAGPGIRQGAAVEGASLLDIAPTVLALYGLPPGADMDGRVLDDVLTHPPALDPIPSWEDVPGDAGRHDAETAQDPDAAQEMLQQMIDLGYIEKPSGDSAEAVRTTQRELDYNLALSLIDAGMHPAAAPILARLYGEYPLEFRFGQRLALCLQAMGQAEAMTRVLAHLDANWREAAREAQKRLTDIGAILAERKAARDAETASPDTALDAAEAEAEELAEEAETGVPAAADAPDRAPLMTPQEGDVLRRLRAIARGNPQTLEMMAASIATERGDRQDARARLERLADRPEARPGVILQLAQAQLRANDPAAACQSYDRALAMDPENVVAHLGKVRASLRLRDPETALHHAERALALRYQMPAAHYMLGLAQWRNGRIDQAIVALERAIAMNPNFPEAHLILARINRRLGDVVRAAQHLTQMRAIRTAPQTEPVPLTLPDVATIDRDAGLPAWPRPPEHMLPPLAIAPISGVRAPDPEGRGPVVVVSGLPRSGTSMAMQMLVAGGLPAMADDTRPADANNPRGYLEYEPVKRLQEENDWLDAARDHVLKVVVPLVPALPQACDYRVILMRRDPAEIAVSQGRMLARLGREGGNLETPALEQALRAQFDLVQRLLAVHEVPVLVLDHAATLTDPEGAARQMAEFLGRDLDLGAMRAAVDPTLWRERSPERA